MNEAVIYAGTEDRVEFFEEILSTLGLNIEYDITICDGEYEIYVTLPNINQKAKKTLTEIETLTNMLIASYEDKEQTADEIN